MGSITDGIKWILSNLLFSYMFIFLVAGTGTGLGVWHCLKTDDISQDGTTSIVTGLTDKDYRISETTMFVFTQVIC